jgi:uncharacterized protein YbaP (TraB family)
MKQILFTFLSIFTIANSNAQKPKENALLWKIEGKNSTQPSYLFGTFHMLCPTDFEMPDTLKSLLSKTNQLFLELDIDDPQMNVKMMKHINMKEGVKLKDLLSTTEYDTAIVLFKQITGMNLKMFESYKPFILSSFLYPRIMACNTIAFEKELSKLAKESNLETKGLETIEDQLSVFDNVPYKTQAKMFIKSLLEIEEGKIQMQKMVAMYKSKNINAMQKTVKGDADLGKHEKVLLHKRNKNWVPIMDKEIATHSTFFAVGAGHLGGKKGVINLLRKSGYTVTPIFY